MFPRPPKLNYGFTLIELLVVIGIVSVLSSVVLASINAARTRSRDTKRRLDLKQLANALELYYDANRSYPLVAAPAAAYAEGRCNPPAVGWSNQPNYSGAAAYIPNLAPTYISVLPGDPAVSPPTRCYVYISDTGQRYLIWAHFGAEGPFSSNDPMIRILSPACDTAQNTFYVSSGYPRCY